MLCKNSFDFTKKRGINPELHLVGLLVGNLNF